MKLSMWILAEWLNKYQPRLKISDGTADICGVRFMAGEPREFSHDHVFIGRADEAFSDISFIGSTMLVHGYDFIFVTSPNTEEIINEVLAAFDYYNNWESNLWGASSSDVAMQHMIDISDEVFGYPARIMDFDGNILAISSMYNAEGASERWKNMYETRVVQISNIGTPVITSEGEVLPEWEPKPRQYYTEGKSLIYIASIIKVDDEPMVTLLIEETNGKFSTAHCQLAAIFCDVLTAQLTKRRAYQVIRSRASILSGLLSGEMPDAKQIAQLNSQVGNPPFALIDIRCIQANTPLMRKGGMLTLLRHASIVNISIISSEDIVSIVQYEMLERFLRTIEQLINSRSYTVGISLPFQTWIDIPIRYKQAVFALLQGRQVAGVYHCKDYAFDHMVSTIRDFNYELELSHPALTILQEYDLAQNAELFETLYQYLTHERNITTTAKALFIHRNSLIYRINRIHELTKTDLDNPDERTFILLSYKMRRRSEPIGDC